MNTRYLYSVGNEDASMQIYYYERLKENINSIINYLNSSINSLKNIDSIIDKNYSINDCSIYNVNEIENEMINRMNYLKSTIIPSINKKINSLK